MAPLAPVVHQRAATAPAPGGELPDLEPDTESGTSDTDMSSDTSSEGGVPLPPPPAPAQDVEDLWSLHLFFGTDAIDHHSLDTLMAAAGALRRLALAGAERPDTSPDPLNRIHGLARRVLNLGADGEVDVGHLRRLGSLALAVPPDQLTSEAALASRRADPDVLPDVESVAGIDDEHWVELFFGPTARDTHAFGTLRDTAQALRRLALAGAERPVQLLD
ncbi:hypothetical protein AB4Z54_50130, partial [Streptomyces sp. MCAF7]